jgi:hypothetical protein
VADCWRQDLSAKTPASTCSPPASEDRTGRICTATPCQGGLPATSTQVMPASSDQRAPRQGKKRSKSLPFCRSHPGVYRNPVDFPSLAPIG